jgi:hypothetical protein
MSIFALDASPKQDPNGYTFEQADLKREQRDIDQIGGITYEHCDNVVRMLLNILINFHS